MRAESPRPIFALSSPSAAAGAQGFLEIQELTETSRNCLLMNLVGCGRSSAWENRVVAERSTTP